MLNSITSPVKRWKEKIICDYGHHEYGYAKTALGRDLDRHIGYLLRGWAQEREKTCLDTESFLGNHDDIERSNPGHI